MYATSPGLPVSTNRIGTSSGWGDLPAGEDPDVGRHILKPSPGCLPGTGGTWGKMQEATADGEEPILNRAGREEVRRGRVDSTKS